MVIERSFQIDDRFPVGKVQTGTHSEEQALIQHEAIPAIKKLDAQP